MPKFDINRWKKGIFSYFWGKNFLSSKIWVTGILRIFWKNCHPCAYLIQFFNWTTKETNSILIFINRKRKEIKVRLLNILNLFIEQVLPYMCTFLFGYKCTHEYNQLFLGQSYTQQHTCIQSQSEWKKKYKIAE